MTVAAGTRLGPYEITAKLGEGGMGEVWRATDSRLKREVAIKVLPPAFTEDKDRLARFEREAQLLAQLHHPNIASIFGLEELGGGRALVMELVEGEDLALLIARGPLPLGEALAVARQVAAALEAAHEQGIVHRDLKPANVMLRADGTVKVLDFGLAKAMAPATTSGAEVMNSPTLTARATQLGVIVGTAAYMSPEQAKGRSVDRRADIWAFGAVLYEMLTGRRAFEGDDVSEVMASVLKSEPDWAAVPPETPPSVRRLLRRALEKDPRRRLSSIGDARLELDEVEPAHSAAAALAAPPPRALLARLWPVVAGMLATAAVAALLWPARAPGVAAATRLSIEAPDGRGIFPDPTHTVISPDGRQVALVTFDPKGGPAEIWIRPLDSLTPRRLEGTSGASLPFWSPDSRTVGFGADGKLKTVPVDGGRVEVLCGANNFRGAAWSRQGTIVFAPDLAGPLYRVAASGGEPVAVTVLDAARKESGHRFPTLLPDGEHFLYATLPARKGQFDIYAGSLRDRSRVLVASLESAPLYAEPGWLLFARHGGLAAQRFDARSLKLGGEVVPLADEPTSLLDILVSYTAGYVASVSSTGTLAYFSGRGPKIQALWLDATGKPAGALDVPPASYRELRISPDGRQAVLVRSDSRNESGLWLADLERGGLTPLSRGSGHNQSPVWSPDGQRVVFASDRDGPSDLFLKEVSDSTEERPFYSSSVEFKVPAEWSPDGKWVLLRQVDPDTLGNIYLLPTAGAMRAQPYLLGPTNDVAGPVSPDGRWLAYLSEESGTPELYVQSFPTPGHRVRVTTGGAGVAWWTPDQKSLLYLDASGRTLWTIDVEGGETLRVGAPRQLWTVPAGTIAMDPMPDRQRWLALVAEQTGAGTVTVVQNALAGVAR